MMQRVDGEGRRAAFDAEILVKPSFGSDQSEGKNRPPIAHDQILEVLNTITDPCSLVAGVRAGLVDMGLVSSVEVDGGCVRVTLGLTEPGCLMGHAFLPQAKEALEALPGVSSVEVRLDHHLPFTWNESRMTPEYRAKLEAHRASVRERMNQIANTP